ncbi:MAG: hypothetical protein JSW00_12480 [Thermoplasmata archaeon]|nr:MAG: hypothetical protein JSW00_12480 [Thermoplasmata archaeon]
MEKERKVLIIVLIAFAIVIASIGYFVYLIIEVETVERSQSYEYKLEIIPDETGEYTVYVPIVINEDKSISELMDDLHITKGDATYEIIETEHGWALKIVSNTEVSIESSIDEPISFPYLSMLNESIERKEAHSEVNFWVFYDKLEGEGNITLSVHLSTDSERVWYNGLGLEKWSSGTHREEKIDEVTVTSGWQKVPGYISIEVSN